MAVQKRQLFHYLALTLAAGVPGTVAAQGAPSQDWTGAYIGLHSGGALGFADVSDPFGPSLFGDDVRTPGLLAGGQAGYNWQFGSTVVGIEADADWADMDGTNTCFAYSGYYVSANCRAHIDALGTFTGRLGWALPFDGRTLVYGKGGLAWEHSTLKATTNDEFGSPTTQSDGFHWGWTLGAGVERAISSRWSLKAEYDFLSFGRQNLTTPASGYQTTPAPAPNLTDVPGRATHVDQDLHLFKLGINYRLGDAQDPDDGDLITALTPNVEPAAQGRTQFVIGTRYVHGWGQFHKDLGIQGEGLASLASRLTYETNGSDGAEIFGRLDTASGVMVKGVIGAGTGGGALNDEDWGLPFAVFVPYSNTLSSVDNTIRYGIVDVGYDWWRGTDYTVTPFIGYSYFQQHMKGYGCSQNANPNSDCAVPIPASVLGIAEYDTWKALRLGLAVDMPVTRRVKLSAEAAYLPYVNFNGTDDHVLRALLSPEDGHGIGVQLEGMLTYAIDDAWSVGVGGRYWSMWTTSATVNFGGAGVFVPMRYAAEQAHLLVQGSYKFDMPIDPLP